MQCWVRYCIWIYKKKIGLYVVVCDRPLQFCENKYCKATSSLAKKVFSFFFVEIGMLSIMGESLTDFILSLLYVFVLATKMQSIKLRRV